MTFYRWLQINHNDLLTISGTIVDDPDEAGDLYSCVVEQLLNKPKKIDAIPDQQKKYYFIKVLKTNYYSKTSPYHYQYRKHKHHHTPLIDDITEGFADEEYTETLPDMMWVEKTLNEEFDWYERDLFFLWVELGSLTNVSKQTKIPLNSVGRHINKIKIKLKEKWEKTAAGN